MKNRNHEIEQALRQRFPGWKGKFYSVGEKWEIITDEDCKDEFYEMYPSLTKAEADKQIIDDIMEVVNQYMPYSTLRVYRDE